MNLLSMARPLLRHPMLWPTAVLIAFRLAAPGWWRRRPFLPRPDPAYLQFRMETQYGSDTEPDPEDLIAYLAWVRATERARR